MEDEIDIKKYLLGELSEEDREQIEKRLLSDEAFYRQVVAAEEELALDFACGDLTDPETESFRQSAPASPAGNKELRFERALRRYVAENSPLPVPVATPPQRSWRPAVAAFFGRPAFSLALTGALIVAVGLSTWSVIQNRRLQVQIAQIEANRAAAESRSMRLVQGAEAESKRSNERIKELEIAQQDLQADLNDAQAKLANSQPSIPTMQAILLMAGGTRSGGGETQWFKIKPGVRSVTLLLDVDSNEYTDLQGELRAAGGTQSPITRNLPPPRKNGAGITVRMSIPARYLPPGDYQINLSGKNAAGETEEIESFTFRVKR